MFDLSKRGFMQLLISEYSSIGFSSDWRHHFEQRKCYSHRFLSSDVISVIYSCNLLRIIPHLIDSDGKDVSRKITIDGDNLKRARVTSLGVGCYTLEFRDDSRKLGEVLDSSSFEIVDSLSDSVLLEYSNRMSISGLEANIMIQTRLEGGFLHREKAFHSDGELFKDQNYTQHNLGMHPYETHVLTIGTTRGVPYWMGKKVNMVFSTTNVKVDGYYYTRSDGAGVETLVINERYPLYVYKLELEPGTTYMKEVNIPNYRFRVFSQPFDKPFE